MFIHKFIISGKIKMMSYKKIIKKVTMKENSPDLFFFIEKVTTIMWDVC